MLRVIRGLYLRGFLAVLRVFHSPPEAGDFVAEAVAFGPVFGGSGFGASGEQCLDFGWDGGGVGLEAEDGVHDVAPCDERTDLALV